MAEDRADTHVDLEINGLTGTSRSSVKKNAKPCTCAGINL